MASVSVAPRVGAWIETSIAAYDDYDHVFPTHVGVSRGLDTERLTRQ